MKAKHFVLLATALSLASISHAWASPRYTIKDLGVLEVAQSYTAYSVNSSGVIVGSAHINAGLDKPFIYRNGHMSYIDMPAGVQSMDAVSINDSGKVLLSYSWQTFTWEEGKGFTQINGPNIQTAADAMNNAGQITGLTQRPDYTARGYVNTGSTWTYIDGIGNLDATHGTAINDLGQVAGYEYNGAVGNSVSRPFFWDGTTLHEIDTLGGNWNEAHALNDKGQVVGHSSLADGSVHGFIWQGGTTMDLGTLSGSNTYAGAINNLGQVVGWSGNGFLWENGSIKDLNTLIAPGTGWRINAAYDINDLGQIVGDGYYQGTYHAFLMTPVPEPSSAIALILGLVSVCGARLRNRRA